MSSHGLNQNKYLLPFKIDRESSVSCSLFKGMTKGLLNKGTHEINELYSDHCTEDIT